MTDIISTITLLSGIVDALSDFLPKLVTFATVAAAFLPVPESTGTLANIHRIINLVAFNVKNAKNRE